LALVKWAQGGFETGKNEQIALIVLHRKGCRENAEEGLFKTLLWIKPFE